MAEGLRRAGGVAGCSPSRLVELRERGVNSEHSASIVPLQHVALYTRLSLVPKPHDMHGTQGFIQDFELGGGGSSDLCFFEA